MTNESGTLKEAKDAIMDNEESIGEKAPGSPFALVALSYVAVLAVVCFAIGLYLWAV